MILATIAAFAFTSCSRQEGDNQLRFSKATVASLVKAQTDLPAGSMGVFAVQTTALEGASNIQYTGSEGGSWTSTTPIKLHSEEATNVYAYYPYDVAIVSDLTSGVKITVDKGEDYLWATSALAQGTNTVSDMVFSHALSKINVTIQSSGYADAGVVTKVELANNGAAALVKTATLALADGTISGHVMEEAVTAYDFNASGNIKTEALNASMIVVPSSAAMAEGAVKISLTVDGKILSVNLPAIAWEGGKQYTYTITVKSQALAISAPKVNGWGDGIGGSFDVEK